MLVSVCFKTAMVLLSTCLMDLGKAQAVLMLLCACIITYYFLRTVCVVLSTSMCVAWRFSQ